MTPIIYIRDSGAVKNAAELMSFAKQYPADFVILKQWAKEEMMAKGIPIDEK